MHCLQQCTGHGKQSLIGDDDSKFGDFGFSWIQSLSLEFTSKLCWFDLGRKRLLIWDFQATGSSSFGKVVGKPSTLWEGWGISVGRYGMRQPEAQGWHHRLAPVATELSPLLDIRLPVCLASPSNMDTGLHAHSPCWPWKLDVVTQVGSPQSPPLHIVRGESCFPPKQLSYL